MGYKILIGDITTENTDAIVNSMGVDGDILGKICKKVIEASKSSELEEFIKTKKDNKQGEIFITDAYHLPCKHIIHLVTPFRKDDNDDLDNLRDAIINVILTALKEGYKTLSIPFIGMGFNGYLHEESFRAITEACNRVLDEDIDIRVIMYYGAKKYNRRLPDDLLDKVNPVYKEASKYKKEVILPNMKKNLKNDEIFECIEAMSTLNMNHYYECDYEKFEVPFDFIVDYCNHHEINIVERSRNFYDRRRLYQLKNAVRIKKKDAFLLGFIMGFNETEMVEFLIICGLSYSPSSNLDRYFRLYFTGKRPKELFTPEDLDNDYYDFCGEDLDLASNL